MLNAAVVFPLFFDFHPSLAVTRCVCFPARLASVRRGCRSNGPAVHPPIREPASRRLNLSPAKPTVQCGFFFSSLFFPCVTSPYFFLHISPLFSPDISLTFLRCCYFGLNRHTFCLCSLHFPVGSGLEEGFSLLTVAARWGDTNQDLWTFAHHANFNFWHGSVFTLCVLLNALPSFSFLCGSLRFLCLKKKIKRCVCVKNPTLKACKTSQVSVQ